MMKNRVDVMFEKLKAKKEGALMCYLPAIGPNFTYSLEIADAFVEGGVDMFELCIPGGAPWLDGSPMQTHHKNCRQTGITVERAFELAAQVRARYPELPILPMGYTSAILKTGVDRFVSLASEAGMDGFELPDYPAYRARDPFGFHRKMREKNMYSVNFIDGISLAPEGTPTYEFLEEILADAKGFLFMTASPGATGGTGDIPLEHLQKSVGRVKEVQKKIKYECPVLVGFGLTKPEHVEKVIHIAKADAVVVGSAVSRYINRHESPEEICKFIKTLKQGAYSIL
jgi:tryptophan synthase alpha chain